MWPNPASLFHEDHFMRTPLLILAFLLTACAPSPALEEGRWEGTLTPMNHPEMANPIAYEVRQLDGGLSIDLIGPSGQRMPTRRPHLEGDSLFFSFEEPEEQVQLHCALGRVEAGFAGRCADDDGKWARFTMEPPA